MSSSIDLGRWPEADALLDEALTLPAGARDAFLHRSAGHDPLLLAALLAVLAEASRDDLFLAPGGVLSGVLGDEIARSITASEEPADALVPGARLEQYEIIELIGRGGMGEVYRARDTRLNREVALKVLPRHLAGTPDRVARFQREARALAVLNHPGIGAIYGAAEDGVRKALVLELVHGPTLAERLNGRALPLDEALSIGRKLAEAIEAAHESGILHRDLKPGNIKVTQDKTVKVLDFGLAKAVSPDVSAGDVDLSAQYPRLMLGTPAYMSPEQVRGGAVDERSDIWAFGCVLFEMLTGARAFQGTSPSDVMARVLEREPAFGLLPAATPASIRRLLRRCLDKVPDRRLGYMGDALLEFDDAAAPTVDAAAAAGLPWGRLALTGAAIALAAGAIAWVLRPEAARPPPVSRFVLPLAAGDAPVTGFQPALAFSPDGRTIVYRARRNGVTQLFRRSLNELEPVPIAGTENATAPFFSPDGRWLGFDGDGVLKRVALAGGAPVVICNAPGGMTAAWLRDESIVFATNTSRILQRVPASGGTPASLTALDAVRGDTMHLLPQALPDGGSLLFTIVSGASRHVAVRLASGETRVITEGTHGRYVPGGHLVFWREGALWGAPFDLRQMTMGGAAVPLALEIHHTDTTVLHYDIAPDGSMVYLPAAADGSVRQLVWLDREGRGSPLDLDRLPYARIALSPDGARVALAIRDRDNTDIWVAEPGRKAMIRLTFEPTIETMPAWSPRGRIAFRSEREGPGIFQRDAQGAGPIERLTETDGPIHSPYSWTPDGRTLLLAVFRSFRHQAIASVTPPDRTVRILLDGDFAQLDPQVSPDGRWMAYQSDESGRFQIYVRPYPTVEAGRWQISTDGGTSPRWGADGRELFFYDGEALLSVRVTPGRPFAADAPRRLFRVKPFGGRLGPDFEVAPDQKRFLFILDGPPAPESPARFVLVQNWVEELRAKLAGARQ